MSSTYVLTGWRMSHNWVWFTLRLELYRQSVRLGDKSLETHDQCFIFSTDNLRSESLWNILSDERMGLSFTTAAGPRQRSHSQVRVPRDSWPHFPVSDSRLPQPGGPGPPIYIPLEHVGTIIPPGTGFLFVASYDSQGYGGGIRPASTRKSHNWS
jgi:hypothetical protein